MRLRNVLLTAFLATVASVTLASAETIAVFSDALSASDPTQLGRLSRNGIPQDWLGSEPYPGEINPTTAYTYKTYVISSSLLSQTPFIQVSFDDALTNTFISAYEGSYSPTSKATNWLGDPGTSGNFFGTDPLFFQFVIDPSKDLVLVVNSTGSAGIGEQYGILVEGFIDTEFNDPPAGSPVPEPSTLALLGTGLVGAINMARRRITVRN
jgi:hypothetical protein